MKRTLAALVLAGALLTSGCAAPKTPEPTNSPTPASASNGRPIQGNGVDVLARYTNNRIAAAVVPYGAGKVAVSGPHPEAPADWYQDYELPDQSAAELDLGDELVRTVMARP